MTTLLMRSISHPILINIPDEIDFKTISSGHDKKKEIHLKTNCDDFICSNKSYKKKINNYVWHVDAEHYFLIDLTIHVDICLCATLWDFYFKIFSSGTNEQSQPEVTIFSSSNFFLFVSLALKSFVYIEYYL